MIKLSKASKMPCKSWSLQALDTCPASKKPDGTLVDACKGCYATTNMYRMPSVIKPRLSNQIDWKRETWVQDMVKELDNERYFRWFDSGDVYDLRLAKKILEVMQQTTWVKHWLPTRMYKFSKFLPVFEAMELLSNVVVRYSSDSVTGETISGKTTSTITPYAIDDTAIISVCRAYERQGKCGTCRACWSKDVPVIAYPAHGASMAKVIGLLNI